MIISKDPARTKGVGWDDRKSTSPCGITDIHLIESFTNPSLFSLLSFHVLPFFPFLTFLSFWIPLPFRISFFVFSDFRCFPSFFSLRSFHFLSSPFLIPFFPSWIVEKKTYSLPRSVFFADPLSRDVLLFSTMTALRSRCFMCCPVFIRGVVKEWILSETSWICRKTKNLKRPGQDGTGMISVFFSLEKKEKNWTNLIRYHPNKKGDVGHSETAVAFILIWRGRFCRRFLCRHQREVRCRRTGFRIEYTQYS